MQLLVYREKEWRKDSALKKTSVDGQGVGDLLPQPHRLLSVKQEVDDPSDE